MKNASKIFVVPVSLAILGWLSFGFGVATDVLYLKLTLLSAARLLP